MTLEKILRFSLFSDPAKSEGAVRADEFARKLSLLVSTLNHADRYLHSEKHVEFFVTELRVGSTHVVLEERQYHAKKIPKKSATKYFLDTVNSIKRGGKFQRATPLAVGKSFVKFAKGVTDGSTITELSLGQKTNETVVIGADFVDQCEEALVNLQDGKLSFVNFKGEVYSSFDGIIKEVDLRHGVSKAKFLITDSNIHLDCNCSKISVDQLRDILDKRVRVNAVAEYDGKNVFPKFLTITNAALIKDAPKLNSLVGNLRLEFVDGECIH